MKKRRSRKSSKMRVVRRGKALTVRNKKQKRSEKVFFRGGSQF